MQVYEPIKIYYLNSLYKHCKNVCGYNITLKRIDGIINGDSNIFKKNKKFRQLRQCGLPCLLWGTIIAAYWGWNALLGSKGWFLLSIISCLCDF